MKYVVTILALLFSFNVVAENKTAGKGMQIFQAAGYVRGLNGSNKAIMHQCGKLQPDLEKKASQARVSWLLRNKTYISKSQRVMQDTYAMITKKEGAAKARTVENRLNDMDKSKAAELVENMNKAEPAHQRKTCVAFIKLSNDGKMDVKVKSPKVAMVLDEYK